MIRNWRSSGGLVETLRQEVEELRAKLNENENDEDDLENEEDDDDQGNGDTA